MGTIMKSKRKRTSKFIAITVSLCLVLSFTLGACGDKKEGKTEAVSVENAIKDYNSKVDTKWAYDLAVEVLNDPKYADNRLGDRQAGSDAEHATAEKIVSVMEDIGLTDVKKDAVKVDRIQAGDSGLTLAGDSKEIILHAYQTVGTPEGGLDAEIIDIGEGTLAEYEGVDVQGKILLLDIDQSANWWIGTPVVQAIEKGAVAVLANNVAGFSEVATDAYNANDFCGPETIPTASITRDDAKYVRSKMTDGKVAGKLSVDNEFSKDGESYNVYGTIKGKDSSESILFGAHYDAYYESFQDDTIAWTGVLAIAKAMKDAGYTPERDIVFCLHGAEEWGEAGSSYDWALGSYRQITEAQKDWQGKVISFINFELSAYEFADYTYTHSAPENYALVKNYTESELAAKPDGVYKDGILTDGYQTYTYSDDFSYYVSGVPSFINGFLIDIKSDDSDMFDFYHNYYHTNYDTPDTYNEAVLDWQLKFYGGLGIYIDQTPALELDFTTQADRLDDTLDKDIATAAGVDVASYGDAVTAYRAAAETLAEKVTSLNEKFADADTDDERESIRAEARELNAANLAIFKNTQDALLGLSAETPIVPHEWYQENIALIDETIGYLKDGDAASAADETAWAINGAVEWYAMAFDEATVAYMQGTYEGKYGSQNWATGKTYTFADVEKATRSLVARYEEENGDFAEEISIYESAKTAQADLLKQKIADEVASIQELTKQMAAVK
jgi:Iap family predicted aminopeptidase